MASRINRDFYGDVDDNIRIPDTWKTTYYWIQSLPRYGTWDLSQNGDFDTSAAPWGMPECSWSALPWIFAFNDSGLLKLEKFETKKRNTPLYFMYADNSTGKNVQNNTDYAIPDINAARALMGKSRIIGKTTGYMSGNSYYIDSTNAIDSGYHLNANANQYTNEPLKNTITTFLDYQKIKMIFRDANFLDTSFSGGSWSAHTVNATDLDTYSGSIPDENVGMINAIILPRFQNDSTPFTMSSNFAPFVGVKTPIPERLKKYYYDDNADEWIQTGRSCSVSLGSINGRYYAASSSMTTLSAADTKSSNFPWSRISMFWGNWCEKKQVFDDVSYHWELMSGTVVGNKWIPINDGGILGSTNYQRFLVMKIDAHNYDTIYQAFKAAVMHEISFLGFPFIMGDSLYSQPIGTNGVYLPIFDTEHMMTTGRFINSSDSAALDQINYTWGDVFDTTIPEYDPEYVPPEPDPEEGDKGDLSNSYTNRYTNAGGLAQWVVSQAQLVRLAAYLNGSYLPTQEDLDGDFKGTNPMNYIVSVQKYPFTLPNVGNSADIYVGKINTGIQGKKLFADWGGVGVLPINSVSSFDFEEIYIEKYYDDFRDYQSQILLFMPFVGTDELDPRLYMGHSVGLIYRVDYNTGSVIAEIKRDGLTMETKNSTISITIPFLAANMGAYQNQLAQLAYSKDMAKIKGVGTALSAGFTMAAGAQGTMSSGQPPLAALSNLAQAGTQLAANATQLSQLDYQIEHTAPQVGTISTAAAATAFFMDDRARIVIVRPKMLSGYDAAEYSHTIGNACCQQATLSSFSGFTVAAAADLSGVRTKSGSRAATEEEKNAILKALQSGIYL